MRLVELERLEGCVALSPERQIVQRRLNHLLERQEEGKREREKPGLLLARQQQILVCQVYLEPHSVGLETFSEEQYTQAKRAAFWLTNFTFFHSAKPPSKRRESGENKIWEARQQEIDILRAVVNALLQGSEPFSQKKLAELEAAAFLVTLDTRRKHPSPMGRLWDEEESTKIQTLIDSNQAKVDEIASEIGLFPFMENFPNFAEEMAVMMMAGEPLAVPISWSIETPV